MTEKIKWIRPAADMGEVCPVFRKEWREERVVLKAVLRMTAIGVYEAFLNGKRIGDEVLAPGWTAYQKRLQVQEYDVTALLQAENSLTVTVGKGWARSPMPGWIMNEAKKERVSRPAGLYAGLVLTYADGETGAVVTDGSWGCGESAVRFSEIYDGERYDARFETKEWGKVQEFDGPTETLIPQEGERILQQERVAAKRIFTTPAGETLVDFGQEVTGWVELHLIAHEGDTVRLRHGEVLDKNGNFYNENYRGAKAELLYICRDGEQTWHPSLTFFGFRYVKLEEYPGEPEPEQFTAVAVYSAIRRTGFIRTGSEKLNRLFSNILWGQRGNFLDVPTDCPQRDERLGWTGDAQVFVKTASYNFDVEKFFRKWLHDMAAEQRPDGAIGQVIPDYCPEGQESAAWGDAAVICPWQIYQTYGDKAVLEDQFACMKGWVDCITAKTTTPGLWTGGEHFGDWLGLDAPAGSYKGSSREDFIASAFYVHAAELLVKAGRVLGKDMREYEKLHKITLAAFRSVFSECRTQTEYVLSVWFGLAEDPQKNADALAEMIRQDGCRMRTGFVGTPYLLHVLSSYGHVDLAYSLLLREQYPSWLYAVNKGATTIWEHWDGIMENGDFWSADMNSFNHYAYGSVADWIYEQAAGIRVPEDAPGFSRVRIEPKPDKRLGFLEASIRTRHGLVKSAWYCEDDAVRYEVHVDMPAVIVTGQKELQVAPGDYIFWGLLPGQDGKIRLSGHIRD